MLVAAHRDSGPEARGQRLWRLKGGSRAIGVAWMEIVSRRGEARLAGAKDAPAGSNPQALYSLTVAVLDEMQHKAVLTAVLR